MHSLGEIGYIKSCRNVICNLLSIIFFLKLSTTSSMFLMIWMCPKSFYESYYITFELVNHPWVSVIKFDSLLSTFSVLRRDLCISYCSHRRAVFNNVQSIHWAADPIAPLDIIQNRITYPFFKVQLLSTKLILNIFWSFYL